MISRQLGGRLIALVALPLVVLCGVTLLLSAGEQVDQEILQRLLLGGFILCVVWSALVGADLLRAMRTALASSDSSSPSGYSTGAVRSAHADSGSRSKVDNPVESELERGSIAEFEQQAEAIHELQRDEEDPDRLKQLFSLDQSLAKLRRAARGLATMTDPKSADHQPPTEASSAVALLDVLTSGLGSVEHFERVQIGPVADLICANELGEDLAHLISELIDVGNSDLLPDRSIELAAGLSSNGDKLLVQVLDATSAPAETLEATNHLFRNPLAAIDDPSQVGIAIASRLALRMQGSLVAEPGRDGRTLTTAALDATLFPPRPGGQRPPLGPGPEQPAGPSDLDDQSPEQSSRPDQPKERPTEPSGGETEDDRPGFTDKQNPSASAEDQRPDLAPPKTLRDALGNPGDFETGVDALLGADSDAPPLTVDERETPGAEEPNPASPAEGWPRSPEDVRSRLTEYREGLESGRNGTERPDSGGEPSSGRPPPKYPKPQRAPRPTDPAQTPQLPDEEES